mmetsp:Transcript_41137/g.105174  ORF Transcript_41137/g.105174 Transcript_41137/m.105174 type:complete len:281 (-) Transcript_41137:378-1220(-)
MVVAAAILSNHQQHGSSSRSGLCAGNLALARKQTVSARVAGPKYQPMEIQTNRAAISRLGRDCCSVVHPAGVIALQHERSRYVSAGSWRNTAIPPFVRLAHARQLRCVREAIGRSAAKPVSEMAVHLARLRCVRAVRLESANMPASERAHRPRFKYSRLVISRKLASPLSVSWGHADRARCLSCDSPARRGMPLSLMEVQPVRSRCLMARNCWMASNPESLTPWQRATLREVMLVSRVSMPRPRSVTPSPHSCRSSAVRAVRPARAASPLSVTCMQSSYM